MRHTGFLQQGFIFAVIAFHSLRRVRAALIFVRPSEEL